MALQKETQLPTGVSANYFRISEILLTPDHWVRITVELYLDKNARDTSMSPISQKQYEFNFMQDKETPGGNGEFESLDAFTSAYNLLMQKADFEGATRV